MGKEIQITYVRGGISFLFNVESYFNQTRLEQLDFFWNCSLKVEGTEWKDTGSKKQTQMQIMFLEGESIHFIAWGSKWRYLKSNQVTQEMWDFNFYRLIRFYFHWTLWTWWKDLKLLLVLGKIFWHVDFLQRDCSVYWPLNNSKKRVKGLSHLCDFPGLSPSEEESPINSWMLPGARTLF